MGCYRAAVESAIGLHHGQHSDTDVVDFSQFNGVQRMLGLHIRINVTHNKLTPAIQ